MIYDRDNFEKKLLYVIQTVIHAKTAVHVLLTHPIRVYFRVFVRRVLLELIALKSATLQQQLQQVCLSNFK